MVRSRRLIEEFLQKTGFLSAEQLREAKNLQRESHENMDQLLLRLGYIKDTVVGSIITEYLAIAPVPLSAVAVDQSVIDRVPSTLAYRHRIVPIGFSGGVLTIATENPFNFLAIENLEAFLGVPLEVVLASPADMATFLEQYYSLHEQPLEDLLASVDIDFMSGSTDPDVQNDAPIIKLVKLIIIDAFKHRASDIHLEPLDDKFRVRYRIDGVLHEMPGPPQHLQGPVISRIKLMAGMDIAEKRLPQDGRIKLAFQGKTLDLRVSTLPASYGESVVLRILDKSSFLLGLSQLGFHPDEQAHFERFISMPHGIILDTGPTGSGKTTTLYASLNFINKPDRKLVTIEDPVEYQLTGINQVQVKPQINLTFAQGLRSILRQAPDVIMVGEIRDMETAQIAIQAALTGHLVFSTLHTNDAAGAVTRLIDMGIQNYLVASSVQAILAQRLVRLICPECKTPSEPTPEEIRVFGITDEQRAGARFVIGKGCAHCSQTGFRGRIAIYEILEVSEEIRDLIFANASSDQIKRQARLQGMRTLRQSGVRKVLEGLTTLSEVMRLTQPDPEL